MAAELGQGPKTYVVDSINCVTANCNGFVLKVVIRALLISLCCPLGTLLFAILYLFLI